MYTNASPMTAFLRARGTEAADLQPADQPHDNLGPNFNVAIWVLTGAAIIFLCLRLYCKLRIRRGLWWDDYVLILATVSFLGSMTGPEEESCVDSLA